jgi:hypothetical protein
MTALFHAIWDRISNEPVLTLAVVQAAILTATAFGLSWNAEQVAQVGILSAAILGFIARRQVSPT